MYSQQWSPAPSIDGDGPGIAHREALAGDASGKQMPAGRSVQAGVAHDDGFIGDEARIARMLQNDLAAGHALADVIIGIALQVQMQAAGIPDTEALTRRCRSTGPSAASPPFRSCPSACAISPERRAPMERL